MSAARDSACRWLGYSGDINQTVPRYKPHHPVAGGLTRHPDDAETWDVHGDRPRVPPGYLLADPAGDPHRGPRTILHNPAEIVSADTWMTDGVFKLSASERLARGEMAEGLRRQVRKLILPAAIPVF